MMQQLRNSTKWIMILVAMAFVGLMVFEWGMDISGRSSGAQGEIGRVNGTPVLFEDYMASYRNLYDRVRNTQEIPVTSAQNSEIEDQAWNEVVTNILIRQELQRRGIMVTDEELRNAALFSPPPEWISDPAFQTDGQFDLVKYQQIVSGADPQTLLQLEAFYREIIPRGKLLRQVSSGIYLSDGELWDLYRQDNETASVSYVSFEPLTRVADDQVDVTPREISDYYSEHREDFLIPASATIVSALINKAPTPADTAAVLERAERLRQSILDGEDFAEVAMRESSGPTAAEGGDLGVIAKGDLLTGMDSVVFGARLNRVSEPVTSFGVHLIEVTERWGQDSAQVRHIALDLVRADESEFALLALADSLEALGESIPLAEAATALGLQADTLDILQNGPFVPGAGDVSEGADWIFDPETQIGDGSPVFENSVAFYSMELVSFDPSRYLTEAEAETAIRNSIGTLKKVDVAAEEASELLEEVLAGRPLSEVAREYALELRDAGPFTRTQFVSGLGRFNAAVGASFGLEVGEVSGVVEANGNVFVIERTASQPADSLTWVGQLELQRELEIGRIRQTRLDLWVIALREAANIVDRREQALSASEDEQVAPPRVF